MLREKCIAHASHVCIAYRMSCEMGCTMGDALLSSFACDGPARYCGVAARDACMADVVCLCVAALCVARWHMPAARKVRWKRME